MARDAIFPPGVVAAFCAILGAIVGSFLNVVIARVPAGESIVAPRSRCPRCAAPIAWYDNVPILSWALLRARCRACGARISRRYPIVEALGAATALLAFRRHGATPAALVELGLVSLAIALAFIDLETWLLPHALTWPLLALALAAGAAGATPAGGLGPAALGGAVGFGAFAILAVAARRALRKEALGLGDVWLLGGLGAWLGARALLPVVLLASVQGSAVGIALIVAGRAEPGPDPARTPGPDDDWVPPRHAVPFGPFLVAGALEWLYLGPHLARAVPLLSPFA
jgi:leader peptidase (prepilin peptidase) / N-methyltransferase